MLRFRACLLLLGLASGACGGKSFDANAGSAGSGASQSGSGSAEGGSSSAGGRGGASPGGSASGGVSASGTSAGGQAGNDCTGFDDDDDTLIRVQLVNKTSQLLYVGTPTSTCGNAPLFQVEDDSGAQLQISDDCRVPCSSLLSDNPSGGCAAICLAPTLLMLHPGASFQAIWSGLDFYEVQLPAACAQPSFGDRCDRARRIRPGTFVFSAYAGTSADCQTTASGECAACPIEQGACTAQGGPIGGELRTAQSTVELDERYGVFPDGPKRLPSPPAEPGEPAIPATSVQLIFTD